MITEQQKGVLFQQHQQWLDNPVTKQLFGILDKQTEKILGQLMTNSLMTGDTVVERQKQTAVTLSVQLTTIETLKSTIKDTNKFINRLS